MPPGANGCRRPFGPFLGKPWRGRSGACGTPSVAQGGQSAERVAPINPIIHQKASDKDLHFRFSRSLRSSWLKAREHFPAEARECLKNVSLLRLGLRQADDNCGVPSWPWRRSLRTQAGPDRAAEHDTLTALLSVLAPFPARRPTSFAPFCSAGARYDAAIRRRSGRAHRSWTLEGETPLLLPQLTLDLDPVFDSPDTSEVDTFFSKHVPPDLQDGGTIWKYNPIE